jgi:WD40 repeat protein
MLSIEIESVALSPDGKYLGMIESLRDESTQTGMANIENGLNDAGIWDVGTGRRIKLLSSGERHHTIAFGPTGDLALAAGILLRGEYAGASGRVSIWPLSRTRAGKPTSALMQADFSEVETQSHEGEVYRIAVAPDGASYATESAIWKRNEVGGFVESARLPAPATNAQYPSALAFGKDGKSLSIVRHLAAAENTPDKAATGIELEIWDTAEHPDSMHAFLPDRIDGLGFLPDGNAISVAMNYDRAGNPRVFGIRDGAEVTPVSRPAGDKRADPLDVKFVTADGLFAVTADDRTVYVRDSSRSVTMPVDLGGVIEGGRSCQTALSLDGRLLVAAGLESGGGAVALLFQRRDNGYLLLRRLQLGNSSGFNMNFSGDYGGLAITADGQQLLTRTDGSVHVWNTGTGRDVTPQLLRTLGDSNPPRKVTLLKFSPDGRFMAVAHKDGCKRDASGDEDCDPEEDFMTEAEIDRTKSPRVLILRTSDWGVVADLPHDGKVMSLVFSPRSTYLIAVADDAKSTLTNLATGRSTALAALEGTTSAAAFSEDEGHFALGAGTRTSIFTIDDPQKEIASVRDTGFVNAVAFSGNGRLIATSSERSSTIFQDPAEAHPARVWIFAIEDLLVDAAERIMGIPSYLRDETTAAKARRAAPRQPVK